MYLNTHPIAVIEREKLTGLGKHWGVLLPDGMVAHCTQERNAHIVTFAEFAAGKQVKEIRRVPPSEHYATLQRVRTALAQPRAYDLLQHNCEIFANRVTGYKPESPQVQGVLLVLGLFAILRMATT